jgi:hypothetical protein
MGIGNRRRVASLAVAMSAFAGSLLAAAPALAANFNVNDDPTLRAAILAAGDGDTITFTGDITLGADLPAIQDNLTIVGQGNELSGNTSSAVSSWASGSPAPPPRRASASRSRI